MTAISEEVVTDVWWAMEVPCESIRRCDENAAWLLLRPCGCHPKLCQGCKEAFEAWRLMNTHVKAARCPRCREVMPKTSVTWRPL